MNTDSQTVIVSLLDKTYPIKCPAAEIAQLQQAAIELDGHMRNIYNANKQLPLDRIAIMAALNIGHELIVERKKHSSHNQEQHLQQLSSLIEQALTQQEELTEK